MMPVTRILVVDDNPANLKLIGRVLEFEGYRVIEAASAEDAVRRIRELPPDLILMDIQMAGMDGLSLTRLLKADTPTRNIPVIALTAYAMKGDEQRALDAGCDGYLTKPIDTRTISAQIRALLRAPKLQPPSEKPRSLKILVVEDFPADLKLASAVLTSAGHRVIQAESAEKALVAIRELSPELILLDLKLPDMGGLDFTRHIRADASARDIPIVAVTSYSADWTARQAREAGCTAYFDKPIDTKLLLHEIADIAARRYASKPPLTGVE
jgi:two-component system cell cycle response regulator